MVTMDCKKNEEEIKARKNNKKKKTDVSEIFKY